MKRFIAIRLSCAAALYLTTAALLLVAGCTPKAGMFPQPLEYYIGNARPLQGEKLPAEYLINYSFECFYTPQGLIGRMELPNKRLIHLADLQTGEVTHSAVPKGRGPNESLMKPFIDLYGNNLYANDIMGEKVLKISIDTDSLIVEEYFKHQFRQPAFAVNLQAASDSLFVFFLGTRTGGRLALTNNTGQVLDTLVYPVLDDPNLAKDNQVNFNLSMTLSPCGSKLFVQNYRYSNIRRYSIAENKITLDKTFTLLEPKYTIKNGKEKMAEDNVVMNQPYLVAGEKYVYMLANPETLKENREREKKASADGQRSAGDPQSNTYLLVFDYDFNLVQSYLTDAHLSYLTITPDPATVYASDHENHCMRKYTLPQIR